MSLLAGAERSSIDLAERIKALFDPQRILAPGRYEAGGMQDC
jgi:FAD/FMN-containing dehydrogenase